MQTIAGLCPRCTIRTLNGHPVVEGRHKSAPANAKMSPSITALASVCFWQLLNLIFLVLGTETLTASQIHSKLKLYLS